jgi:orotate phosphoribosyltransferase
MRKMSELNPSMQELAHGMLQEDIVKFGGPFQLKDRESVAYVNLRDMISLPPLFNRAVEAYGDILVEEDLLHDSDGKARLLEGIPEAAVYYAGAVAVEVSAPLIQHRVKAKQHGQPRPVEGRFEEGDEVILIDDVITSAGSKLEEVESLGEMGLKVAGVAVLVDREQGGRTEVESRGLQFASAMTLSSIARYALDENVGNVTQDMYDELLAELNAQEVQG